MNEFPDLDAIKMFVGQLPKQWTENDVRLNFENFGRIYMVNVLRDKITKHSRGCCFITFYTRKSALEAQNACHNIRVLAGMSHPIQMKPANNENRHERKIFVGMLTKSLEEAALRLLFLPFGLIEEVSILRDSNSNSRGCGFVTFGSKASAISAIRSMHQSTIMDGCSSPLVVKIADTQPRIETNEKRSSSWSHSQFSEHGYRSGRSLPSSSNFVHAHEYYLNCLSRLCTQHQNIGNSEACLRVPYFGNVSTLNDLSTLNFHTSSCLGSTVTTTPGSTTTTLLQTQQHLSNDFINSINLDDAISIPLSGNPFNFNNLSPSGVLSRFPASSARNLQQEGPDGSNLFIYHLPQDFSDVDLIQCFSPYGPIISAKVFINKSTNLSKCFGFVSYCNAMSAQLAINELNGFQIGSKRLKVQLKRPKDKPY